MSQSSTIEYDPHVHAEELGLRVEYQNLRTDMGLYVPSANLVLLRPKMKSTVERCVLAHEIAHHISFHRRVSGLWSIRQERTADLSAARRLIQDDRFADVAAWSQDPREWAIELRVTGDILLAYLNGRCAA